MNKRSLKFQIIMLSFGIIIALGITSGTLIQKIISTSQEVTINDFKSNATTLQSSIAAQFYERYGDVQAFSINPAIVEMDKAKMIPFLNQYTVMYSIYDLIVVVDLNGNVVATNDIAVDKKAINTNDLYSKNFKDAPWFKAVVDGQFTNDEKNGFSGTYVEDPHLDEMVSQVYGEKRYGSSFSTAIKDQSGKTIGVITNRAGSRWFELEFQKLYDTLKIKGMPDTELTMIDKNGVVLVDYDPALNSNDTTPKHDYEVLGKLNLAEKGLVVAKDLVNHTSGAGIFSHARKKINQVAGYSPIVDPKFVSSLGWGVIVRSDEEEVFAKIFFVRKIFYMVAGLIALLALFVSYKISVNVSKNLQQISANLSSTSHQVGTAATQIATSSEELSHATTEQAASLQETSSSIEEISSMISNNTENAKQASIVSEQSLGSTQRGKEVVDEMIKAIGDIHNSNNGIADQINDTNKEIEKIVIIINNIGEKTKVINDIVFQTKLLSFNASVEAARAGEQGKGFAVVAEEVGNLAAMSGSAAQEISQMLDGSIKTVETIVKNSKEKIGKLVLEGKEKIETGTRVAHECEEVFNGILSDVSNISRMVSEISSASQEQAQGVQEITKAISQLDQVTHQNTNNASQSANAAGTLSIQAEQLNSLVQVLVQTIEGGRDSNSKKGHLIKKLSNQKFSTGPDKIEAEAPMNFDEAIKVHARWKQTLTNYIQNPDGSLKSEEVCKDDKCTLGKWIYHEGLQYSQMPDYQKLKSAHGNFHKEAADIIKKANTGAKIDENLLLGISSPFTQASTEVASIILSLKDKIHGGSNDDITLKPLHKKTSNNPLPSQDDARFIDV